MKNKKYDIKVENTNIFYYFLGLIFNAHLSNESFLVYNTPSLLYQIFA